jgi:hypothetical protein
MIYILCTVQMNDFPVSMNFRRSSIPAKREIINYIANFNG